VFALQDPGETANAARQMVVVETQAAQHWARSAWWQSSRSGFPMMPSPKPPESLALWSDELRQRHGVAKAYDRYLAAVRESDRLIRAQDDAYSARDSR
jgi:hypothetical protein